MTELRTQKAQNNPWVLVCKDGFVRKHRSDPSALRIGERAWTSVPQVLFDQVAAAEATALRVLSRGVIPHKIEFTGYSFEITTVDMGDVRNHLGDAPFRESVLSAFSLNDVITFPHFAYEADVTLGVLGKWDPSLPPVKRELGNKEKRGCRIIEEGMRRFIARKKQEVLDRLQKRLIQIIDKEVTASPVETQPASAPELVFEAEPPKKAEPEPASPAIPANKVSRLIEEPYDFFRPFTLETLPSFISDYDVVKMDFIQSFRTLGHKGDFRVQDLYWDWSSGDLKLNRVPEKPILFEVPISFEGRTYSYYYLVDLPYLFAREWKSENLGLPLGHLHWTVSMDTALRLNIVKGCEDLRVPEVFPRSYEVPRILRGEGSHCNYQTRRLPVSDVLILNTLLFHLQDNGLMPHFIQNYGVEYLAKYVRARNAGDIHYVLSMLKNDQGETWDSLFRGKKDIPVLKETEESEQFYSEWRRLIDLWEQKPIGRIVERPSFYLRAQDKPVERPPEKAVIGRKKAIERAAEQISEKRKIYAEIEKMGELPFGIGLSDRLEGILKSCKSSHMPEVRSRISNVLDKIFREKLEPRLLPEYGLDEDIIPCLNSLRGIALKYRLKKVERAIDAYKVLILGQGH